jgi:recombination protein RecT
MNAVTKINPVNELRAQLEQREASFQAALPRHIPVERFTRVILTAVQFTPELLECTRVSLFNAALKAAQDGLLPDGREAAMVVRKNFRAGTKEVSYQPMIAGIRKKARNSGDISSWDAHVVCANDHFQFQLGDNPQVNHSYDLKQERGPMIGAYSVAVMKDGSKSYEVMSIADINRIRDQSDGWKAFSAGKIKSTPWSTSPEEMARKTVARRHSKVLPMSSDLDDLIRRDDDLYDFKAAEKPATAIEPPRGLAGRLDALAGPATNTETRTIDHDPETGEVQDENSSVPSTDAEAGGDHSDPTTDGQPPADPIQAAKKRGFDAARGGLARRAMPGEYRAEGRETEAEAWLQGYEDGQQQDGE